MLKADIQRIKDRIAAVLGAHAHIAPERTHRLLPLKSLQGKLYEAHVLATICENLVNYEGLILKFMGGSKLVLRQKGGHIERKYPFFKVYKGGVFFGELFTDIYFSTLSYRMNGAGHKPKYGDFHELDIALVKPYIKEVVAFEDVLLAVECKNTSIEKRIIREVIGFRRELSFYDYPQKTNFEHWPISVINACPNSVHMLYCSDNRVTRYKTNCLRFGILLQHHNM